MRRTPAVRAALVAGVDDGDLCLVDVQADTVDDVDRAVSEVAAFLQAAGAVPPLGVVAVTTEVFRDALRICPPIGVGGELEQVAARARWVPAAAVSLLERLLAHEVLVAVRPGRAGDLVPVATELDGTVAVAAFSSRAAAVHADVPATDLARVTGRGLWEWLPAGTGLVLDPGCLHSVVLPAQRRGIDAAGSVPSTSSQVGRGSL